MPEEHIEEPTKTPDNTEVPEVPDADDLEARLKALESAERAVDSAYGTGKAERAQITKAAQLDAAEAVAMAGIAMEADVEADEAMRLSVIAEKSGDRERAKVARAKERDARKKAKQEHNAATKSAKRAYDAIKFSDPTKMGFMRAVQVVFALHIIAVLVWLMLTSRDAMTYDVTSVMDWIMVILEGVAFWMFINRYKIARPFVIVMAALGVIVPTVFDIATGQFNIIALATSGAFYIFLFFYFIFSERVKKTLVNDFAKHDGSYDKEEFVINRRGWPFIRNLVIYFIVFSIIGHWMEMGMCQFIIMGIVEGEYDPSNTMLWRDWLYPFPMEGFAVVAIALVLYPLFEWLKKTFTGNKRWLAYVISFIAGALLCTIIEGGMGMIVNADYQLWDYRENFGNIGGQVCLQNTMAFGVVAAIITWFVYPMLERWIARVPRDIMNIVAVVIFVFGAIVWSLYLINPPGVDEQNKDPEHAVEILTKQAQEQQASARDDLVGEIGAMVKLNEEMHDAVNKSNVFAEGDKARLLAEIDAITELTKALKSDAEGAHLAPIDIGVSDASASASSSSGSASAETSSSSSSSASSAAAA